MDVDIVFEDARWIDVGLASIAQSAVAAVCKHFGYDGAGEVVVLACDAKRIANLNADFRGKPQPTNVLSWPSHDFASVAKGAHPTPPPDFELGDIAISYDTCVAEALDQAKPFADHVTHLMVHAMLHLLGYDHINDADAALMEGIEVDILAKLRIRDPYRCIEDNK